MNWLILVFLLFTWSSSTVQPKPGLYLTLNYDMEICDNQVQLINSPKMYCLSDEPVIEFNLFERVEELVYDSLFEMRKFRIVLTKKGQDHVSKIAKKLPGHDLALIVNGILVSVIELEGIHYPRSIMIWDKNDSQAMEWLHRSLVRTVHQNNKKS